MPIEESQNLSLSKRQADRVARTIFERHYQKERQEKRALEDRAKRYSIDDIVAKFNNTDISREEILEGLKEYQVPQLSEGCRKKYKDRLANRISGLVAAALATGVDVGIYLNTIKENRPSLASLIFAIGCMGLTIYQGIRTYNSYQILNEKKIQKKFPSSLPNLLFFSS